VDEGLGPLEVAPAPGEVPDGESPPPTGEVLLVGLLTPQKAHTFPVRVAAGASDTDFIWIGKVAVTIFGECGHWEPRSCSLAVVSSVPSLALLQPLTGGCGSSRRREPVD
jgi:hypothetical protein